MFARSPRRRPGRSLVRTTWPSARHFAFACTPISILQGPGQAARRTGRSAPSYRLRRGLRSQLVRPRSIRLGRHEGPACASWGRWTRQRPRARSRCPASRGRGCANGRIARPSPSSSEGGLALAWVGGSVAEAARSGMTSGCEAACAGDVGSCAGASRIGRKEATRTAMASAMILLRLCG
eukprot:6187945-Pleurochrysis_carterae.AAC.1